MRKRQTYKSAGVDIEKAEISLGRIKYQIARTHTPEVLKGIGLFSGFYQFPGEQYKQPVLVSSTDGVGTKLKIAILSHRHDTIGQDLVNHCINDIAVCGARPLFFLDYFACGKLEPDVFQSVIGGIACACQKAEIPLIGGETAEMPDFYQPGDYDISGTVVGVVEKDQIITGRDIRSGDILVGVASNGLHTNGFSLARKVLLKKFQLSNYIEELECTLMEELLKIHENYYPLIQAVVSQLRVKGISHITGGGIGKNTYRILPENLFLELNWHSWPIPPIFQLIQKIGNVPEQDMRRTFNMGIGLVFIVSTEDVQKLFDIAKDFPYNLYEMGVTKEKV